MRGWSLFQIALLFPIVVVWTAITSEFSFLKAREWAGGWAALVGVVGATAAALTVTRTLHLLSSPIPVALCAYVAGALTTAIAFYALEAFTPD